MLQLWEYVNLVTAWTFREVNGFQIADGSHKIKNKKAAQGG